MKSIKTFILSFVIVVETPFTCILGQTPDNTSLASEMQYSLQQYILKQWYPRSIDTIEGGYYTEFRHNWEKAKIQPKMIVTQSRLIWTSAQAAMFYHDSTYIKYARHGVKFLKDKMWDRKNGGFYTYNPDDPTHVFGYDNSKQAYGNAFAIYGLSAFYMATRDSSALNLAKKCFYWLEKNSHDSKHGGYVDRMTDSGEWINSSAASIGADLGSFAVKDYNSSIHLLEALTSLYSVWPDSLVKVRLNEMLRIVRDTIVGEKGYETLYFTPQWNPISNERSDIKTIREKSYLDHISFGHDVETAYLILESSHVLNLPNDTVSLRVAKKMVDQALAHGFDLQVGGFYGEGYFFKNRNEWTVFSKDAQWWVQAEGLNALLLMSNIFPDNQHYYKAFLKQWDYINRYLIDKTNGEWYYSALNTNPEVKNANKGSIWKVNYHNGRALMNCILMLKNGNALGKHFYRIANGR